MSIGQTYLDLQELDLAISRDSKRLADLPELHELALRRRALAKLRSDALKRIAERKDIETDLSDLAQERKNTEAAVTRAQAQAPTLDHRDIQDLEIRLATLAKQLDRIDFESHSHEEALMRAQERERKLAQQIASLEAAIKTGAAAARESAGALKEAIHQAQNERQARASTLDEAALAQYERAVQQFSGLGVEYLEKNTPSICRTALSAASLADVQRAGEVSQCPYCRRLLVCLQEPQS
ncbi:hypothetical protein K6V98_06580 [Collinsella sp. AGMB00827]|uniref:C4-type zinc ribbon domain-containing protein n=1 Tax=Collinsella ureilytica TaxID=2869515 RepID=A0ABS7MLN6_9ACTN|nr:C4-type zinc ribbon domain-containing protein [Collinsella urealyticum]MBY4798010.1 hypothetical protein [Collinsella urealyticum]